MKSDSVQTVDRQADLIDFVQLARSAESVFETARFNRSRTSPYLHSTWFPNHLREVSPTGFLLQNRQCHAAACVVAMGHRRRP